MNETACALPDVLRPNLDLVICGSAAGHRSAEVGCYYAGRGNKFWRILGEVGLTSRHLAPEDFGMLPDFGIGLTDLAKRYSGPDSELRAGDYDAAGLREKIEAMRPRVLAFNGKNAAKNYLGVREFAYGLHQATIGETCLFVVPSTSSSANWCWDPAPWRDLAELVRQAGE